MDGVRIGAALRAVRLRHRWRQADVARRAGVSDQTVSRLERGRAANVTVHTLEAVAFALDMSLDVRPRWRGGELDRVLNAAHAAMHETLARMLRPPMWDLAPEVSFSVFGERGVIDALAFHGASRSLLVIELKTAIVDVQGMLGSVDRYVRLAPRLAAERGWPADVVAAAILVRESRTNRRRVSEHAAVLRAAYPRDGRTLRAWIAAPSGPIRSMAFLPNRHATSVRSPSAGVQRVRAPRPSAPTSREPARPTPGVGMAETDEGR
jgi:transcriptional regulator with XRE-family HTH domain